MSATWYLKGLEEVSEQNVDWVNDTIKIALTTEAYVPDFVNHDYFSDITNEVSGTGYTAGGATLANATITPDTSAFRIVFDGDDITDWNAASGAAFTGARWVIIYKSTGVAGTSVLLGAIDLDANKGAPFDWEWSANGILFIGRC